MGGLFARVGRLFKGFVGLFVSGLEEENPEVLFEAAKQDFRDKMAQYNQALARIAGIAERLKIQISSKTSKIKVLEQRIMANYKAGNAELAGSLARELQELKVDLEHDTQEFKDTETSYQANLQSVKVSQKEFEMKVRHLEQQINQVKIKEAQAEAVAALNGVAFKVGDTGDTFKNVEDILNKNYEKAAGKARVSQDLMVDSNKVKEKESEMKALDQVALADFLAQQGIKVEQPVDQTEISVQKEMGPQQKQAQ
ncbi:MAG: PspA/IM30 family protein [Candidatus Omnitrophota bacterium]